MIPNFAVITVHEEVVDLVIEVLLLERNEVLPLLRFNNLTQFLNTSSVIIRLEFVFLNLRLTFGEDLLFLSVQKSSNLCVFSVQLLTTCHNRCPCSFHNGSLRSFGHGRRRLTDRQAFSLGVVDMYSVCVMKHLLERGVIVIHILEEPLLRELWLGQGLDICLHEVVVLGPITCAEVRLVRRTQSPFWRSTQC